MNKIIIRFTYLPFFALLLASLKLGAVVTPPSSPVKSDEPIQNRSFFTHSSFSIEECENRAIKIREQTSSALLSTDSTTNSAALKKRKNAQYKKMSPEQKQTVREIKEAIREAKSYAEKGEFTEAERCYLRALELGGSVSIYEKLVHLYTQKVITFLSNSPKHPSTEFCQDVMKVLRYLKKVKITQPSETFFWIKYYSKHLYVLNTLWFMSEEQFSEDDLRTIFNCFIENYDFIHFLMSLDSQNNINNPINYDDKFARFLIKKGFQLIKVKKQHKGKDVFQHVWVHKAGLQIRVKPFTGQFTIALTRINPLDECGALVKEDDGYGNRVALVTLDKNELVKFGPHFIVPAHFIDKVHEWAFDASVPEQSKSMDQSHFYFSKDKKWFTTCTQIETITKAVLANRY